MSDSVPGKSLRSAKPSLKLPWTPIHSRLARPRPCAWTVDAKSSKEIAVELGISIKTVECHRTNLFRKLKVRSVVELVRYALRHGKVD
jgi:Bacterial regulatory proteins, luxR family